VLEVDRQGVRQNFSSLEREEDEDEIWCVTGMLAKWDLWICQGRHRYRGVPKWPFACIAAMSKALGPFPGL
jgi:hypothetical protein